MNEDILGKWQGAINISQMPLEVILNLQQDTDTRTVPVQGLSDFPLLLKPFTEVAATYGELTVPVEGDEWKVALQIPDSPTSELVIIQAESGPTNKDGNTIGRGKNGSLKMLAEDLAAQGIASVRFDKRGIGENTILIIKEQDLRFNQYVNDVVVIIDYMKQDERLRRFI